MPATCSLFAFVYRQSRCVGIEFQYLDLVERIIATGHERDDRTGVGTLALFGERYAAARVCVGGRCVGPEKQMQAFLKISVSPRQTLFPTLACGLIFGPRSHC